MGVFPNAVHALCLGCFCCLACASRPGPEPLEPLPLEPLLTVVTPTYYGHLQEWTRLTQSILNVMPHESGTCTYRKVRYHTVVSNAIEKTQFVGVLDRLVTDSETRGMFRVSTLYEVLDRTGASVADSESESERIFESQTRKSKFWIQSIKKVFGCLDAGQGTCFLLDSESLILRNGVCHAATAYARTKAVLVSKRPSEDDRHHGVVETSRRLLGGHHGNDFGEFFAMEVYHWFIQVSEVRDFLHIAFKSTPLPELALSTETNAMPYIEETFYHFAFLQKRYGYRFVHVESELPKYLGNDAWHAMSEHASNSHEAILEIVCKHLVVDDKAIGNLARFYQDMGVLVSRFDGGHHTHCPSLAEYMDICVSDCSALPMPAQMVETKLVTRPVLGLQCGFPGCSILIGWYTAAIVILVVAILAAGFIMYLRSSTSSAKPVGACA